MLSGSRSGVSEAGWLFATATFPKGAANAAAAEACKKLRRFCLFILTWHVKFYAAGPKSGCILFRLDVNILPTYFHAAARVNLQANDAIAEFGRRIGKIHNLRAVELRHNVRSVDG